MKFLVMHSSAPPWHLFPLRFKNFKQSKRKIKYLYKKIQKETMGYQEKHHKNKTFCTAIYLTRCLTPMMISCGDRESARHNIVTYNFLYVIYRIKIR